MAGFKTFADNETLTHSDVNGYLMGQVVARFPSTTARSAQIGTPVAGMVCYVTGVGLQIFTGSAWTAAIPVTSVAGRTGAITLTKSDVGLSNVDNVSDASKPVSTATQTALDAKAPIASPTFTGTVSGVSKSMVGLGSVDNTSDSGKPVSTAQQTALDAKAPFASPAFTGTPTGITKTHVGLGSVDNTSDAGKPVSTAQQTALDLKAPLASPALTGTATVSSKIAVGGASATYGINVSSASGPGLSMQDTQASGQIFVLFNGNLGAGQFSIYDQTNNKHRFIVSPAGSIVVGQAAVATTATDGFLYLPTCAGAPTGVPTTQGSSKAAVYDTTNNKLWIYNGSWRGVVLA